MILEGAVVLRRDEAGEVEVVSAPPVARISLQALQADPQALRADGNTVTVAGQVTYRVTDWDPVQSALVAALIGDQR